MLDAAVSISQTIFFLAGLELYTEYLPVRWQDVTVLLPETSIDMSVTKTSHHTETT